MTEVHEGEGEHGVEVGGSVPQGSTSDELLVE